MAMFKKFLQRKKLAQLAEYLALLTPQRTAAICEQSEENEHFIALTIGFIIASSAGHFIREDLPKLGGGFRKINRNVIAFEALAFSAFAVREYFEPLDTDYPNENASESFKDGFAVCRSIIQKELGDDHRELFGRRLMEYAQANSRGGMKDASDVFRGTLQSIGNASIPASNYSRLSLDMNDTLQAMVIINVFATTMPKAAADSIHGLAEHFGFF
jgi:hypothetical protein